MLTELRISSMLINTMTAFLRAMTPYTPMQNRTAPSSRKLLISMSASVLPGEDDGADDRGEEDERERPEGQQVGLEDVVADSLYRDRCGVLWQLGVLEAGDQHPRHDTEHQQCDGDAELEARVVQIAL